MRFVKAMTMSPTWDEKKFNLFCQIFNVKSIGRTNPMDSATYFSRLLATSPRTAIRHKEEYDRMDRVDWRLFDHVWFFKTNFNKIFAISTPYLTEEMSQEAFIEMRNTYPITRNIEMRFINPDLKFMKNGDIMLLFEDWRLVRLLNDNHYRLVDDVLYGNQ